MIHRILIAIALTVSTFALTVLASLATAVPAQADARNCGHSTSSVHWAPDATGWHRVRFAFHWDEKRNGVWRHMHSVRRYTVAGFPYGLSAFHSCP